LGVSIGLDAAAMKSMFESQDFADAVHLDIEQARQFQISGVPFFVFDRKYAISGAQDSAVFLNTLQKALETLEGSKN
jgi:predicted DsbA family dithiol-disulfide isomerase